MKITRKGKELKVTRSEIEEFCKRSTILKNYSFGSNPLYDPIESYKYCINSNLTRESILESKAKEVLKQEELEEIEEMKNNFHQIF